MMRILRPSLPLALALVGCSSTPAASPTETLSASALTATAPSAGATLTCDVLVVGGSTSAYAATFAAAREGAKTCLVQPYAVVGGQLTTQGLSASDDPEPSALTRAVPSYPGTGSVPLEAFAYSLSQASFRAAERGGSTQAGGPGRCWVSDLCTTPDVAASALEAQLAPYSGPRLTIVNNAVPTAIALDDEGNGRSRVRSVTFQTIAASGTLSFTATAPVVIEATDLGDLVQLAGIPARVGQESQDQTGETLLAGKPACPSCQQSFTYDVLVQHVGQPVAGAQLLAPPGGYGVSPWVSNYTATYYSASGPRTFFGSGSIFDYRRALAAGGSGIGDVSILDWGCDPDGVLCGNDYRGGTLVGVSVADRAEALRQAHDRAAGWLYYLQNHVSAQLAPYASTLTDAEGVAIAPYVREALRAVATTTIRHDDVARSLQPGRARAKAFPDSGGIGFYAAFDLHPSSVAPGPQWVSPVGADAQPLPFQVPLGALVPVSTDGLVLASKSLGTTHLTNAAYRTHPVEWAIGEAAGALAAVSARERKDPAAYTGASVGAREVQSLLASRGVPLYWFSDVAIGDSDFEAIQMLAVAGVMDGPDAADLRFEPGAAVNRSDAAGTIVKGLGYSQYFPSTPTFSDCPDVAHCWAYGSIEELARRGIVHGIGGGLFGVSDSLTREQLGWILDAATPAALSARAWPSSVRDGEVAVHRELARAVYAVWRNTIGLPPR